MNARADASFICGKTHCADSRETCKPRPFYGAHLSYGRSGGVTTANTPLARPPLELTFGFSSDMVAVFGWFDPRRLGFSAYLSARQLSLLSSPPLTGARALDHSRVRAIGSGGVT